MSQNWQKRSRPERLERRYLFADYSRLRDFLDRAAELSEQQGLYPDMGFGRDYLNITIHADPDTGQLGPQEEGFARLLDDLGGYQ
ncbi:MAG: 4a-hydroxytetrahydrobiopterin dehydratase [Gammaproteobacteria bacterium SHHR-1]